MAFRRFSQYVARLSGSAGAFLLAFVVVLVWAATGPFFHFADTWQLVINTSTTIVTFLMVFLIQNTQNRDTQALHAKIDELIIALEGADNRIVGAEELSDEEMDELKEHFHAVAEEAEEAAQGTEKVEKAKKADETVGRRNGTAGNSTQTRARTSAQSKAPARASAATKPAPRRPTSTRG